MQELGIAEWETIVVALLHDALEDSFLLIPEVFERIFGASVALSLRRLQKEPREGYYERLRTMGTARDLLVKLADRLHNLRTLGECTQEKQCRVVRDTRERIIPLAGRLIEELPDAEKWRGEYLRDEIQKLCNIIPAVAVTSDAIVTAVS